MNLALANGFGDAFGSLGKYFLNRQQEQDNEAMEARKAQLKNKLEMDLMKAKFEFAKANPTYSKYVTNLTGDVVAFDQFGSPHNVYKATPEERALRLGKAQADIDKANASGQASLSQVEADKARADYEKVHAGYLQKKIDVPGFGYKPTTPKVPPDKYAKDPVWFDKEANRSAATAYPQGADGWAIATKEQKQPYIDAARKKLESYGYHLIPQQTASPLGLGAFSSLVAPPPGDDGEGEGGEDGDDDSGYTFDPYSE